MKRIFIIITIPILVLGACTPAQQPRMDDPVNSEPPFPPPGDDFSPTPDDADLIRGQVYLDSTELLTLESFPLQFSLQVTGNLPTPCHQLRVDVSPPDAQNKVMVNVYSVADPEVMCIQVLEPFDTNISLGSFPAGRYTLWVNGEMVADFQS